jgi:hypothetical protein
MDCFEKYEYTRITVTQVVRRKMAKNVNGLVSQSKLEV